MRWSGHLLHGVGINDAGYKVTWKEGGKQVMCPFYRAWRAMIERGYCTEYKRKYPTYIGVTVCEDWHTFSKFKAWMECQDWQGNVLDKDILVAGNKTYSPDVCVFVSEATNCFLVNCLVSKGDYPLGVTFHKASGKFRARCHNVLGGRIELGAFLCPNEAHQAYLRCKAEQAKVLAGMQTDDRVAKALVKRFA